MRRLVQADFSSSSVSRQIVEILREYTKAFFSLIQRTSNNSTFTLASDIIAKITDRYPHRSVWSSDETRRVVEALAAGLAPKAISVPTKTYEQIRLKVKRLKRSFASRRHW